MNVGPIILKILLRAFDSVGKQFTRAIDLARIATNDLVITIKLLDSSKKGKILLNLKRDNLNINCKTKTKAVLGIAPKINAFIKLAGKPSLQPLSNILVMVFRKVLRH